MYSKGMIFFTNDGDFAASLSHPSSQIEKEYIFKDNLIKANHLFYQSEYFTSVNLSNFKA